MTLQSVIAVFQTTFFFQERGVKLVGDTVGIGVRKVECGMQAASTDARACASDAGGDEVIGDHPVNAHVCRRNEGWHYWWDCVRSMKGEHGG